LTVPQLDHDPWNDRAALLNGQFRFLRSSAPLGWLPDWQVQDQSLLWAFNLHYFHYLHLLRAEEQEALCLDWIRHHPARRSVAWHPYPTSLRIINWCRTQPVHPDILTSLYAQAAYVHRHLETHVMGNHLLENARALMWAGALFRHQGEAHAWTQRGLDVYRRETERQILPDGGHYERSPLYHALVLQGYLEVWHLLPQHHPDRSWFLGTIQRMGHVLAATTHPDGHLALFNDTTQEIAPPSHVLLRAAQDTTGHCFRNLGHFPETGYTIFRDETLYFIIDGGVLGPDHLLAHAHADHFSYELSVGGHQIVVDTGVFEYAAGPERDRVRSTAAHNTVTVDGVDQAECWSSFRVARRFSPQRVAAIVDDDPRAGMQWRGAFEGYRTLIGDDIVHEREVHVEAASRCLHIRDQVHGRGLHQVESRIHLHPEVAMRRQGSALELHRGAVMCILDTATPLRISPSRYCAEFGSSQESHVLVLGEHVQLPYEIAYTLRY
ncbi:MAG: alginate lyase family protein, partial [Bacteroidota bacterium]